MMEMSRDSHSVDGRIVIAGAGLILVFILAALSQAGYVGSHTQPGTASRPDPGTGIANWIAAVNGKDVSRLYDLAPAAIKSQADLENFTQANEGNILLRPGWQITGFTELNRTVAENSAAIRAGLDVSRPRESGNFTRETVFWHFVLYFEGDEWKVWTAPF